ncbi:MAG: AAA family ATPase [Symploca sp. SIO1B1]|nr:AAA family ATPase [Symploca sp. SIO1B1]
MRLIFLGPFGAGKETQAAILAEYWQIPYLAIGDILRQAIAQETFLGLKAQSFMKQGKLVPDPLFIELLRQRLNQPDARRGWVLDGFPRNLSQAQALEQLLQEIGQRYDWVINFEVSLNTLVKRMLGQGDQNYPQAKLGQSLEAYPKQTAPINLIEFYQSRHCLKTIDGNLSGTSVTLSLQELLELQVAV